MLIQTNSKHAWLRSLLLGFGVLLTLSGCGRQEGPPMAPVQGRVLLNGKPLAGAQVSFIRQGAARFSLGKTDEQGRFILTTFDREDGALIGENKVTVAQVQSSVAPPTRDSAEEYLAALREVDAGRGEPSAVSPKYASPETTDLVVQVVAGDNQFEFNLKPE